jgi:hypothetical protein
MIIRKDVAARGWHSMAVSVAATDVDAPHLSRYEERQPSALSSGVHEAAFRRSRAGEAAYTVR